jgi:arylsulfatase A-like enzyme
VHSRFLLFSLVVLAGCHSVIPPVDRIVLVTLDTTRADRLGCYGRKQAATPVLDGLSREATLFEQALAAVPVTMPSHATMMTGLNPYGHGVRYNMIRVLSKDVKTLAERLAASGFKTGAVPSAVVVAARFGLNQGFDTYDDDFRTGTTAGEEIERTAGEAVDRAIRWWDSKDGQKRFLWVHIYSPHYPYQPPFPYSSRFADRPYEGEIAYMDAELGRLFADLKKRGDWDKTLIVVAGDHGEGLYEHGERWHSEQIYDSTLHVPLLVKTPGKRGGLRVSQPVGLVDVTPTILDYAGVPTSDPMDGASLRVAIETGSAPARSVYFESTTGAINFGWSPLHGVRRGRMKYLEGARAEMYDLGADPHELNNVAGKDAPAQSDLHDELATFLKVADLSEKGVGAPVVDDETLAQLTSLGYVGGPSGTMPARGTGIHPPDMVGLDQEIVRSQSAFAARRFEEAANALDYVLQRDPTNLFALYFRAKIFGETGVLKKAIPMAKVLSRLAPDSTAATDLVGELLNKEGRPAEAAEVYRAALLRTPQDTLLRFHRVLVLVEAHDLVEAENEQSVLEQKIAGHYSTAMARALVEAAKGRVPEALDALRRAADLGMTNLKPVESSPFFRAVRSQPAYVALVERLAKVPPGH